MNSDLLEILALKPGWGSFTRIGKAPDGSDQIQRFSHATAMGSLLERDRYQRSFGEPLSRELQRLHPLLIAKLCRYACDTGVNIETSLTEWRAEMGHKRGSGTDDLDTLASKNGRLVPMPKHWNALWNKLIEKSQAADGSWKPALPLILASWDFSDDREKRDRFMEHLEWAITHGQVNEIKAFLKALDDKDWYYGEK